jgi:hypothetical protein
MIKIFRLDIPAPLFDDSVMPADDGTGKPEIRRAEA